ncbi:hypothetical protein FNJ62_18455 [Streptomyces benahoarensis]|uniref:LigA protein n=1 Tax=Streptomyces benahoarensis TaxID=2595054 RepID=A0A553YXF0_9ACTN|nr:hypothetical protein FNJ62_18455 [Streptomyces benahoarensis]TSB33892.1 hypothetical protein FNZ23_23080 [Streptomyces benahoarensis]
MRHGEVSPGRSRPLVVRYPDGPVEAVMEADALDAMSDVDAMLVRGPLFGVAAQSPEDAPRWRVVVPVTASSPQEARDSLNSWLWFRAKDEAQSRAERRALLAGVARLEKEPVDELTVQDTRYRVVRAEEYAGSGRDGIEQPRATDPEPAVPDWERSVRDRIDDNLLLDPEEPVTPTQAAERLALRALVYAGSRFPEEVCHDSELIRESHPDVVLLPPAFRVVEKDDIGWKTGSGLHASAHEARKTLDFSLTWFAPRQQGLIPWDLPDRTADARAVAAESDEATAGELAEYLRAADRLRTERANQIEVRGTVHRICRARRLLRWGPDGPEGPRPSDTDSHLPDKLHPFLDEDGVVHFDHEGDDSDGADDV